MKHLILLSCPAAPLFPVQHHDAADIIHYNPKSVDTKKLDKWADLLLDTGKRNNLINFKDTKTSTAEVLLPSSDALFNKIDGTASFEVFDPDIPEGGDADQPAPSEQPQTEQSEDAETKAPDAKAAFLARYSGQLKRQSQILLYNAASNPLTAIKKIDKKAREFIDETGVNVAYMVFGFIHWKESVSSDFTYRAGPACASPAGAVIRSRTVLYQISRG